MKYILLILLFFMPLKVNTTSEIKDFRLVHVNAKWNDHNNIKIKTVSGIEIEFTTLEAQSADFKNKINRVPILILYKDGRQVYNWQADLSFKLNITEEDIKSIIKKASK